MKKAINYRLSSIKRLTVVRNSVIVSISTKPAAKKYDHVVCGILACAAEHSPESIKVSSDGNKNDWSDSLEWASTILGRTILFPITEDEE